MAVDDLWHLSRPPEGAKPCGEHGKLVASGQHGRGKRWRVRYDDPNGNERRRLFDKREDAYAYDADQRSDVARGTYVDPDAGKVTFREYAEKWRGNQIHDESTQDLIASHFPNHAYPFFGARAIATIAPSDVQGLVRNLQTKLAPSTIEVIYRFVVSVFLSATRDGAIVKSPCVGIRRPEVEKKRVTPLPDEAVSAIREELPKHLRALADLGGLVGLRQGEAFGLEVERIDFLRKVVHVEQQLKQVGGGMPFLAPPKSAKSRRSIPVGQTFIDRMAAFLAEHPPVEVLVLDRTGRKPVERLARFVVLSSQGRPLRRQRFSETWLPMVGRLRARCEQGHRDGAARPCPLCVFASAEDYPTMHDLRHWYASVLIAGGASVTQVQHRLGHSTAKETLDTYSHLFPDEDDRTRDIVDARFAPARPDDLGRRLAVVP